MGHSGKRQGHMQCTPATTHPRPRHRGLPMCHACRFTIKCQVWQWWLSQADSTDEERQQYATEMLRTTYPGIAHPATYAKDVVARMHDTANHVPGRHPFEDRPRSGRRTAMSKIPEEKLRAVIAELRKGYLHQGKWRSYESGKGLRQCTLAKEVVTQYQVTYATLIKVLKQLDPNLDDGVEHVRASFTTVNKRARLQCARMRLERLARDPNWHKRVFMLDSTHKYWSSLLAVKRRVITFKDQPRRLQQPTDDRIKRNSFKLVWMTCVNAVGGVGPLKFISGTTCRKEKVMARHAHMGN